SLGMGLSYAHRDAKDRVIATYFAKTSVLVAIGFATWLDGTTLTLSLALEALVLLMTARYRREHTGRLLALGTAVVAFAHGCYAVLMNDFPAYGEAGFAGEAAVALAIVVVFGVLTEYYRITPWHTFPAISFPNMPTLNALCQNMEMLPDSYAGDAKPSRMAFAHLLAGIGTLLAIGYIEALLPRLTISSAVGWLALVVVGVGLWRRSAPFLTGAVFLSGTSAAWWFQHLDERSISMNESLIPLIIVVVPFLIISELLRVLALSRMQPYACLEGRRGAWYRNMQSVVLVFAAAAASVIGLSILEEMKPEDVVLLTGSLALVATIFAACLGSYSMGLFALLVMLLTPTSAVYLTLYDFTPWKTGLGVLLLGITATSVESRWWGERPGLAFQRLLPTPYLLYGVFVWWSYWFVGLQVSSDTVVIALVGLAALLALALPWLHRRAMAVYSTLLCTVALFGWMVVSITEPMTTWWYASFAVITMAALGGDRLFAHYKPFPKPVPGRILLVVAWFACYLFNAEVAAPVWYYVGLAVISMAFLGYGAAFRTRTALALSVLSASFATVPLMLYAFNGVSVSAICSAYGAVILYWLCAERGATIILSRTGFKLLPGHRPILYAALTGIPALLGVIGLTHIDLIQDFYLTISWTVWALALFAWAISTRQPWFRYVGLCTIGLALGRAFLVDVWKLEGLYRVGAMLFLGVALLAVAYGYTRWRATQEKAEGREKGEE
ncbi:MAG: DUF2339 domain-containing protein, partial [Candidatus Hydrogenedentes bacterium]|nr:DUF2339 domain-containing protein [Candidatus Hydrogenedentota bacterium]